MPDDELIFGWQYPMPRSLVNKTPGNDFPDIFWKTQVYSGKFKVKLNSASCVRHSR